MEFRKYQHLERFGTTEVENINIGECHIFPKIDGTNASVWLSKDEEVQAGSRKRHLSLDSDNAGFLAWVKGQDGIKQYLLENPTHRLFGEWLVPHSLKTYKDNAWRDFYVFDVSIDKQDGEVLHEGDSKIKYLHYDEYSPLLEAKKINYIAPIMIIRNPSYEQLVKQLAKNVFLIKDGEDVGEGVVIKNYNFKNKYNRQCFAKIVTSEFKEKHAKTMGAPSVEGKKMIEEVISKDFITKALIEKVHAKIENDGGFNSRSIPQLLNTVYYDLIKEDSWAFIKKYKNPTINFKTLQFFVFKEIKLKKPELF